jgi:Cu-processing system permease protein
MMGYTGAIFKDFFGTNFGVIISFAVLLLWGVVPVWIATRKFNRKDL